MLRRAFSLVFLLCSITNADAQKRFTVVKDLRTEWTTFDEGIYRPLNNNLFAGVNTVYFPLDARAHAGNVLRIESSKTFYLFVNGSILGEFKGSVLLPVDSLLRGAVSRLAIHQDRINALDLSAQIITYKPSVSQARTEIPTRPYWYLRDFVVIAGLIIIIIFLISLRLNPKLGSEYFSLPRLISSRESDEGQASARLTSSANVQFYILCSLLIGFYLLIVLHNLPPRFELPLHFQTSGFWMIVLQWLKLSAIIFFILLLKVVLIFSLTRLFGMWGLARYHFFNWIRLLLLVFGACTIALFTYFIARGNSDDVFVMFLSLVVISLAAWVILAFFKLSGRSGHSIFHLFSYLCATEIIPLIITVKVLFQ